jgi:hypothetical protein
VADQHRIAEHFWCRRIEQRFLIGRKRIGNVYEVLMRVHARTADAGKMLQAKPDARITRDLAHQQRVGFNLADIGGIGSLDLADIRIVRVVVDVDDRREIIVDAERTQFAKGACEYFLLFPRCQTVELLRAGKRRKAPRLLEPREAGGSKPVAFSEMAERHPSVTADFCNKICQFQTYQNLH